MKQIDILEDDDERELEAAGQSILPNMVEQEVIRYQNSFGKYMKFTKTNLSISSDNNKRDRAL